MTRNKKAQLAIFALAMLTVPTTGWQDKVAASAAQESSSVLRKIYNEDQKDRTGEDIDADAKRREQVRNLIGEGKVQSGEDYYYAAFIFQHGQTPTDYLYAHVLAVTALSKGFHGAIWLSAATLDRYLQSVKQPQVFGTQYGSVGDGPISQDPYDKNVLTDSQRALWCVVSYPAQVEILNDVKAGKEFRSTNKCPGP